MALSVSAEMCAEFDSCVVQLGSRAEDLADPATTFVDTIYPDKLRARQHQIVYGRRGAGKTHLLLAMKSRLNDAFADGRALPVYLNGSQLSQEVNLKSDVPAVVALAVYVQIMQQLATEIHKFVRRLNETSLWDRLKGSSKTRVSARADALAYLLHESLTTGQVRVLPAGEVSDEASTLTETSKGASGGASLKLSDPTTLGWAVSAGVAASTSKKLSKLTTRKIRGEVILPFSQVSQHLQELLKLLGDASLVILFDEWSEVDKDLRVQPYLAEMLRRTSSAVPGMYLKLACIPGRTVLATPITVDAPIPLGLEEGDDIHNDVDLDLCIVFAKESLDQLAPFFLVMVKEHVGQKLAWVRQSEIADFETFMTTTVFKDHKPFLELCQASGGVSRDFLNIFRGAVTIRASKQKVGQLPEAIGLSNVRQAAKKVYQSKRASFGKTDSLQLQLLDNIYRKVYVPTRSYYFLLSERSAESQVIQNLYTEKLIHRMPIGYYDTQDDRRYIYFQIDYGTTIDLLQSTAKKDARASYESSNWVQLTSSGFSGWLAGILIAKVTPIIASIRALDLTEVGRVDVDPRKLIVSDSILANQPQRAV